MIQRKKAGDTANMAWAEEGGEGGRFQMRQSQFKILNSH